MSRHGPLSATETAENGPAVHRGATNNLASAGGGDAGEPQQPGKPASRRTKRGARGKRRRPAPATQPTIPTDAMQDLRAAFERRRS